MAAEFTGKVSVDIRDSTPDWAPFAEPRAPEGAPNVLYLVWDDTGIGTWDFYGGLVEMPNLRRIAERGVLLSQFHTTALCSPTRAALLTGRNPTSVGMATIEEFTDGFANSSGRIPTDAALLSEVLSDRGWNTYAVGKWHLTPLEESNLAATKRNWPLSRGFERFYGFLGGEADQWYPNLVYDNHPVDPPSAPDDGYHLSKDLADKSIEFIRDAKVIAPDKPWFLYLCPGCGHAPHHVSKEWADRYAGRFDMGYERYREIVLDNQKRLGLVPADTELSQMNPYTDEVSADGAPWPVGDTVRPWDSLDDGEQRLFCRMAEVFAGFQSYTDAQIGRLLDYLEDSGQLDNTIVVLLSDNGASGEGGPNGSVNEYKFFNGYPDRIEDGLAQIDDLGSPETYNHYCTGWAMAFNTPYKLFKRYASHEGGIADPCVISWPDGISARGEVRDNYINVCDITPTVYELLGVDPPLLVGGVPQRPLEGVSFRPVLADPEAATGKTTQFYSMLGTRGIWHDGWFANTVHPAAPSNWGHFDDDRWELFHIERDRSQVRDLASARPDKLDEMRALWFDEAAKYDGLPLNDLDVLSAFLRFRPYLTGARESFVYYPDVAEVGPGAALEMRGRSFSVLADVRIESDEVEGVLFAHGGRLGGHSLFVQDGDLKYVYNFLGEDEQVVVSIESVPTNGAHVLGVRFDRTGAAAGGFTPIGDVTLHIDDRDVGSLGGVRVQPAMFSGVGEGIRVGRDTGQSVSRLYRAPFRFRGGTVRKVTADVSGTPYLDLEREIARAFSHD
ncbi:arylsulfatase [Prescottella agglutinans]|uniref:Arylsulfatase A-like enzyme n=1 Tax=Prescottella agglutinans TaxID=1644129 RepID=A0ABT6MBH2_9NOCA|nr:arylsulfatase [Prescottella agglutinans]MDH6281657.1 arylsulfatase A-like enzyme [Prescottella agglutinans]